MRYLVAVIALLLTGCIGTVTPGPQPVITPANVQAGVEVEGAVRVRSILVTIGPVTSPVTYPVRARGTGVVTVQYPNLPRVDFQGSGEWEIEPLDPAAYPWIAAAMSRGEIRGARLVAYGTLPRSIQP